MAVIAVRCPSCEGDQIVRRGKTNNGKQCYLCQYETCPRRTFILEYTNRGYVPSVKRQIIDLALDGSGIRDTARVLGISTDTVLSGLKKRNASLSQLTKRGSRSSTPTTGRWLFSESSQLRSTKCGALEVVKLFGATDR
jgi:transposase-like protein